MIFGFLTERKRRNARDNPFPSAWKSIIKRNVPIFHRLPQVDQKELLGCVQIFIAEKHFEGCGGLELNDEIRVTIASQACLLLLHRETDYFPDLDVILVYPHAYLAKTTAYFAGGISMADQQARLGQSAAGVVVLAWDAVRRGATDVH